MVGCDYQGFPLRTPPAALAFRGEALKGGQWGSRGGCDVPWAVLGAEEPWRGRGLREAAPFRSQHMVCRRETPRRPRPDAPHRCG